HWDGNTIVLRESAHIAAVGLTSPATIDEEALERLQRWARTAHPPKWDQFFTVEKPDEVKKILAQRERGKGLYLKHCAACHSPEGERFGRSTAIAELGTDRYRYDSFTHELADKFNTKVGVGYDWKLGHLTPTAGYSNVSLEGIWL